MRKNRMAIVKFTAAILALAVLILSTALPVARHIKLGLDLQGGFEILYQVQPIDAGQKVTPQLLHATAKMIEKRVNIGKVAEPDITVEGSDRIRVKIAGIADQTKLREEIATPAYLTFRNEAGEIVLSGRDLAPNGASVGYDSLNRPEVVVKFQDATKLRQATEKYLGKPLSIYLDDKLVHSPVVKHVISDGVSSISSESLASATGMKDLLNAGSLPAKLTEKQVTTVTASLGEQALRHTLWAGYAASAFILLFMLFVYRLPGLVANAMLFAFGYLCLVLLMWMKATMTLSGIAGFILAIGMAVDANIITYEKLKEELQAGKSIRSAVRTGSRTSLTTIVDAHVTTLIAASVLLLIGTSSVEGFAIILIMTLLVSLFTNVFGSRLLLWLLVKDNALKNFRWFGVSLGRSRGKVPSMPFSIVRWRKRLLACSALLLLAGTLVIGGRGLHLGVDFQSGTRLDLVIGAPFETGALTQTIKEQIPDIPMKPIVKYGENGIAAATTFQKPVPAAQLQALDAKLKAQYGSQAALQESTTDPAIAQEMVRKAASAIAVASLGIVAYTAIRFHYSIGLACIAALVHDILLPVALFSAFRLEIDLTFIAALLTIVGYSLNDTIVIFDRIRSNLKTAPPASFGELESLVDRSLWQTMKRSLYTVLTVFIAAAGLLWLGGESIRLFSLALLIGLVSGTYSSIFVAAQLWLAFVRRKGIRFLERKL